MATDVQRVGVRRISGLKSECLSFSEVLGQSIGGIAPSATPALVIPLVFATAGNGTWLAYLFATFAILLVGANLNQFTKRSASPGSLYSFVAKGLGPGVGVIAGWALVLAYILTAGAVLCGFVNYANVLLDYGHIKISPLILAVVGSLSAWLISYKDIKLSTKVMLTLELISLALIIFLGIWVFIKHGNFINHAQLTLQGVSFTSIRIGLVLAFFSFTCFESSATLGDEARNPLKSIPKSVTTSILLVGGIFVVLSLAEVMGFVGSKVTLDKAAAPLALLATRTGIGFFGPIISVGALISFWACILGCTNAGARVLFQMGRHGVFHSSVGKAHGDNQTPHIAISIVTIITFVVPAILIARGGGLFDIYGWIGTIATFGFLLNYLLIAIAAPIYLKREKELTRGGIVLAVITVLTLLIPIVGSVYPLPAMPYGAFPFVFAGWLVIGIVWFLIKRAKTDLVSDINEELDAVESHFKEVRVREGGEYI